MTVTLLLVAVVLILWLGATLLFVGLCQMAARGDAADYERDEDGPYHPARSTRPR